jgi:hypothetical protein
MQAEERAEMRRPITQALAAAAPVEWQFFPAKRL